MTNIRKKRYNKSRRSRNSIGGGGDGGGVSSDGARVLPPSVDRGGVETGSSLWHGAAAVAAPPRGGSALR